MPTVTFLVLVVLIWGLRRHPTAPPPLGISEHPLGQSPTAPVLTFAPSLEPLSASLVTMRRLLTATWGPDSPDLTVAYWTNPEQPAIRFSSYTQSFLPVCGPISQTLAAMENRLFEEAAVQEVPDRSRLITAWTFLHLPSRRQDLVVQSFFAGTRLEHYFFLMDADGKLGRIHLDIDTGGDLLLGSTWYGYRQAIASYCNDEDAAEATLRLEDLAMNAAARPHAHGWLAFLKGQVENEEPAVFRHLAMALEFGSLNQLTRLERARREDPETLHEALLALHDHVSLQVENASQAGFLMAQSIMALRRGAAGCDLCELLLAEREADDQTLRLLRLIIQRERGAQT